MPTNTNGFAQISQENQHLKQRIAELEAQNQQLTDFIQAVYHSVPYVVFVVDILEDNQIISRSMNQAGTMITGFPVEHWHNKTLEEIHTPEDAESIRQRCLACLEAGTTIEVEEHLNFPSGEVWAQSLYIPVRNEAGKFSHIVGTAFDITARKRQEEEEHRQQALVIEQQSAALAELSTPLLTISDQVVVMPLIGVIDTRRVQQIMEALLSGVVDTNASIAILDVTGIVVIDTQVANALLQVAQAVKLIGAQVIITGIRPEVAQALVGLGVDMSDIITCSTLQSGIAQSLSLV